MKKIILFLFLVVLYSENIFADKLWTSWGKSLFEINPEVIAMVIDSKDHVWISHFSRRSNSVFRNGAWSLVPVLMGKILAVDKNDAIWGDWSILNSYDGKEQKTYTIYYGTGEGDPAHEMYSSPGFRNSLLFSSLNEAWLGASFNPMDSTYGLFQLFLDKIVDGYMITANRYIISHLWVGISDIAEDSDGVLWLGTEQNLWTFDRKTLVSQDDINEVVKTEINEDVFLYPN